MARLGHQRGGRRWQVHGRAVEADETDGRRIGVDWSECSLGEVGLGRGLDRGESVQLALLTGEPVLDGLDHGQLLLLAHGRGLGVGRGQGGRLGVFEVVGLPLGLSLGLFGLASSAEEAPRDGVAGRFVVVAVALGLFGTCLDQAVPFDIESGYIVAARAGHE